MNKQVFLVNEWQIFRQMYNSLLEYYAKVYCILISKNCRMFDLDEAVMTLEL